MDMQMETAIITAILGFASPLLVQTFKKYIPEGWTETVAVIVSLFLGLFAMAVSGGFSSGATFGAVLLSVVAISQISYALVNKALGGKLSKGSDDTEEQ